MEMVDDRRPATVSTSMHLLGRAIAQRLVRT
jgi:hypothetical protein